MLETKVWGSALIDFAITWGTAFLSLPMDTDITLRMIITMTVGSVVATAKGLRTYYATSPYKEEVCKDGTENPS